MHLQKSRPIHAHTNCASDHQILKTEGSDVLVIILTSLHNISQMKNIYDSVD